MLRIPRILCVCSFIVPFAAVAEPPSGSWILAVAANSLADGVRGPQLGIAIGGRIPISRSINLLVEGSAVHSPKIETGEGQLYSAMFDVELHRGAWFGAVGVSHGLQKTSRTDKGAWFSRLSIGREIGPVWLWSTWSGPRPTKDRAESLGLNLEWRRRRGMLRAGLAWLRHRDGEGLRLSIGLGLDFRSRGE